MEVHGYTKILPRKLGLGAMDTPNQGKVIKSSSIPHGLMGTYHCDGWVPQHQVLSDTCIRIHQTQSQPLLYNETTQLPTCPSIHPSGPGFDASVSQSFTSEPDSAASLSNLTP